jgi:hypothetical protein
VPDVTFGTDAATDVGVDVATESSPGLDAADHAAPTSDAANESGMPLDATDAGSVDATCENDCAGQTCCLDKHGNYQGCAASPSACP